LAARRRIRNINAATTAMRQFATIASNAFMELIRQPVFLLIMTSSAVFAVFLASVPYFAFGDDPKLAKDSVLALMLLAGLLAAVLSASNSVAREIRTGTALAVLAKPVGRAQFLLAKYVGLAAALVVLVYVNLLAALLASRMAYDAYGSTDWLGLALFYGFIALAFGLGGFSNFFLRRPFVSDAVLSLVVTATLGFIVINFISKQGKWQRFAADVDWRMVQAGILVLFAVWILAGLALLCSTRLEMMASLAICSGFFLLGLMSDYLFGRRAEAGSWWASVLYTVLPNWQLLWTADALDESGRVPWRYVGTAFGYVVAYVGAALAVALALFEDRELT
jgi:ABC-type transport system involved in cytochrome c biogenesis permease component